MKFWISDKEYIIVPEDVSKLGKGASVDYIAEELDKRCHGVKHDQDKPHMNLLFQEVPNALVEVAKALRMGELKYGRENWKKVENLEDRYLAAMLRHLVAIQMGEKQDKESGLSHLAHVVVNAMFLLDYEVRSEKENS